MNSIPHRRIIIVVLTLFTVMLFVVAIVTAQEGTKGSPATNDKVQSEVSDSVLNHVNWDSLYAGIQVGFAALEPILQKGCFDCHTDKTHYPWYHSLPLVKGMIDGDIRKARKHVDMSKGFPFVKSVNLADDLVAIREQITSGDMPPLQYRFMHWSAKPSKEEADSILTWVDSSLKILAAHGLNPTPSAEEAEGGE